ncbi:glycohydrolase toxin TNT-related protein [Ferruginibacter profundus]
MGGSAAPWFDEVGGGTQYKLNQSIKDLLDGGYIIKKSN